MAKDRKKLGELLIEAGLIDQFQLLSALGEQRQWGGKLASILVKRGFVTEEAVVSVLEKQFGQKCIILEDKKIPPEVIKMVKHNTAEKYCIMPLSFDNGTLTIATLDPTDIRTLDEISFVLGVRIKPILAIESSIKEAIAFHYLGITPESKKEKITITKLPITKPETTQPEIQYTPEMLIEAVSEVLIEKGVVTKEELIDKIRKKHQEDQS